MTTARIDRQTFLAHLRRSGLLTGDEFDAAVRALPETPRGRVVARELVARGILTRFQAEMLLSGRTNGFTLGQYRILDQLGQGGMGRVFKAVHQAMNRVVALKVIASGLVKTDKARQMFEREVRAAARLSHPNIVTAYDANHVGDRHYLVMEFVDGPNLEQLVAEHGPLPFGQACDFIRQAAAGLQYAFEMGMVHRDLKPSNLLVKPPEGSAATQACTIKILDFGLARLHDPEAKAGSPGTIYTHRNIVLGTPDYVSPEQARDLHQADIRSDLYSLGCTLYYLLAGQPPFPAGTSVEKLVRHATEEPAPIERLRPDVPPAVGAIVRRLTAKDPAARFHTPAELAAALHPWAVAAPAGWTVPGPAEAFTTPHSVGDADQTPSTLTPANAAADFDPAASPLDADEDSILSGTLSQAQSATRLSGESLRLHDLPTHGRRIPLWLALLAALAITAGLVALGYLAAQ